MFWKKFFHRKARLSIDALTDWDRRLIAYHEAGHAVAAYALPEIADLKRVTIDPGLEAFGRVHTEIRPHHNATRRDLESLIAVFLAGRLAEEMLMGAETTSCVHDLEAAQQIAADMVTRYGMGERSGVAVIRARAELLLSESCAEMICTDVQEILHRAEAAARKILDEHLETVHTLARLLLERQTLNAEEIRAFFEAEDFSIPWGMQKPLP